MRWRMGRDWNIPSRLGGLRSVVNEFDSLCSCQPNVLRVQPPVTFSFLVGFTRIVKGRLGKMLTLMATLMLFGGNWADVRH